MRSPSPRHSRQEESPVAANAVQYVPENAEPGAYPLPGRHIATVLIERRFPDVLRSLASLGSSAAGPFRMTQAARAPASAVRSAGWVATWRARARGRHVLATMSDLALKDLGLTRLQVLSEIEKPFWRP